MPYVNWVPFGIFLMALIVFIAVGFFRAPVDLYQEALAEIGRLKFTIEDKKRIQGALNELWRLRKTGVDLRNKKISPRTHQVWHQEYRDWYEKVGAQAGFISENFKQWLVTSDQVTQPPLVDFVSPEHKADLKTFNEVLHRLQRFLEKDLAWPQIVV